MQSIVIILPSADLKVLCIHWQAKHCNSQCHSVSGSQSKLQSMLLFWVRYSLESPLHPAVVQWHFLRSSLHCLCGLVRYSDQDSERFSKWKWTISLNHKISYLSRKLFILSLSLHYLSNRKQRIDRSGFCKFERCFWKREMETLATRIIWKAKKDCCS